MYSRSDRFPAKKCVSLLAPNTYVIKDNPVGGLWIPFNSTAKRWRKSSLSPHPSPLTYFPKYRKHRIPGCASMKYTEKRVCKVPSPQGVYPTSYKDIFRTKAPVKRKIQKPLLGCLFKKPNVGLTLTSNVVSVLTEYERSKEVPKYLTFPGETSEATQKYSGPKWSSRTCERNIDLLIQDTPGPGWYDVGVPSKEKEELAYFLEYRRNLFRAVKESRRPPPSCYKVEPECKPVQLYDLSTTYSQKKISFNVKDCVWSKAERFPKAKQDHTPGPSTYDPKSMITCNRISKNIPFTSCCPRFSESEGNPLGPNAYNIEHMTIAYNNCKLVRQPWGNKTTPFSSTVERFKFKESSDLGPGKYDVKYDPEPRTIFGVQKHEGMAGTLPRFIDTTFKGVEMVYEPEKAWKWLISKESHNKSIGSLFGRAARKGVPLNDGELGHDSGFHAPRMVDADRPLTLPGPVPMSVKRYSSKNEQKHADIPYYDVHPKYSSAVFKESFNKSFRIPKPEVPRDLDKPRREVLKCYLPEELVKFPPGELNFIKN